MSEMQKKQNNIDTVSELCYTVFADTVSEMKNERILKDERNTGTRCRAARGNCECL